MPVVAYGALVPPAALEIPAHGWVNLHFSLLPAWRGAAPVQHAVLHGDEVTGASVFQLEEGLDTGPVYGTLTEEIRPTDTVRRPARPAGRQRRGPAGRRCSTRSTTGTARAVPQPADGVSLAPEAHRRGRPGPLGRAGVRGRPPGPRLHAGARRVDARSAASGSSSARCARSPDGPRAGARRPAGRARRTVLVGTATTPVALGEVRAAGKKADARHRLGPRRARRSRGAARMSERSGPGRGADRARRPSRPDAGPGRGRPPSTRPGGPRTRRSRPCTATTRTPTSCCRRSCASVRPARPGRRVRHRADVRHAARRAARSTPIIAAAAGREVARIDPPARDALRLGAYQLLHTRVPAHAAVSTDRRPGARRSRRARPASPTRCCATVAEQRPRRAGWTELAPAYDDDPVGHLAVRAQPSAVDRPGVRRRARRRPGRDRAAADRGQRAGRRCTCAPGPGRADAGRAGRRGGRRAGRVLAVRGLPARRRRPATWPAVARRPRPRAGRGLAAGRGGAGRPRRWRARTPAGSTCAPARAARPACSARSPRQARRAT